MFEITEGALAKNPSRVLDTLQRLAAQGCQLSLDDFGTGSFSLSFLRKLPIHELKIDRSFVEAMRRDADAAAVVRSAISLGKSLDLRVVAEGVEDVETLDELPSAVRRGARLPDRAADDRPRFRRLAAAAGHDRVPDAASAMEEPLTAA